MATNVVLEQALFPASNVEGPRFESDMFAHPSLIINSQYCYNAAPKRKCRWQCAHKRTKTPKAMLHELAKRLGRSIFWRQYFVQILYKDLFRTAQRTQSFSNARTTQVLLFTAIRAFGCETRGKHTVWVKCNVLKRVSRCTGRYTVNMPKYIWKCNRNSSMQPIKIKGKGCPCPRHKRVSRCTAPLFLNLGIKGIMWSTSRPGRFNTREGEGTVTLWPEGGVDSTAAMDVLQDRKVSCPCRVTKSGPPHL